MQPEIIGGRYRVESAIGRGAMGTVWLCRDETLHRVVAVKQVGLLPGESVTDSARALREARSSAGLSHPHVVTVFDVVEDAGHIWLVMEHVPGRSLSQIIKQDGALDPATVAEIGAQVADGLAALHAAGTMHRDVKPGNVLIRDDDIAKISDFGIARTAGDQTLTGAGYVTGTPSYFSPALAHGDAPSPKDDVWALGATLYAAVEGRSPYEKRSNPLAVLHDIVSTPLRRPRRAEFLEPALQRMLDREPESRWSMEDAAHVLRKIADSHRPDATMRHTRESVMVAAQAPSPPRATAAPPPAVASPRSGNPGRRRPGRRTARLAAAALLVLAGLGWAVVQLGDREQPGTAQDTNTPAQKEQQQEEPAQESPESEAQAKEAFVRDYYAQAPGGTDEAWEMLGPSLQEQGRGSYDAFWRTIESVDVSSAEASEDSDVVEVTLTYRSTDGKVSTERKREGLVTGSDGGYLLDTDVAAQ